MPSAVFGGEITSLPTLVAHSAVPLVSNASTSPLSEPTTTTEPSAPAPADSVRPALTRQTARPFAGSIRITVPSAAAA